MDDRSIPPHPDPMAVHTWVYPSNFPVREYQREIVESSLLQNTLVCLPTGLGKTLIAAVVMYNFYKWFPTGCVVFMVLDDDYALCTMYISSCIWFLGPYEASGLPADRGMPQGRGHPGGRYRAPGRIRERRATRSDMGVVPSRILYSTDP
jgi:hypothetical protein